MSWDNMPNGAAAELHQLDLDQERAEALEEFADAAEAGHYAAARSDVAAFSDCLNRQGDIPYCPDDALGDRLIAQWHTIWLAGGTAMAEWLEKIVRADADLARTEAINKGFPQPIK